MKLGAENRNKTIFAVVLAAIAIVLVARMFFTGAGPAPAATPATTAAQTTQPARGRGRHIAIAPPTASLDPRLNLNLLKSSESVDYKGSGRDIFNAQAPPPPIPSVVKNPLQANKTPGPVVPPQPQAPPQPPPINLKFFGFASRPGQPTKIFLSQGEEVFVASEGQIVKGRYKVLHISPTSVEIQDVLSNGPPQTIPLTQG